MRKKNLRTGTYNLYYYYYYYYHYFINITFICRIYYVYSIHTVYIHTAYILYPIHPTYSLFTPVYILYLYILLYKLIHTYTYMLFYCSL